MAQFSLKTNLNQAGEDANGGASEPFSVNAFPEFGASINLPRVLDRRKTGEKMLRGIPVSQGVSRSQIVVLDRTRIDPAKSDILAAELAGEENRLQVALAETRQQILTMQERLREAMGAGKRSFSKHTYWCWRTRYCSRRCRNSSERTR